MKLLTDLRIYVIYIFHLKVAWKLFCVYSEEIQNTHTNTSTLFWFFIPGCLNVELITFKRIKAHKKAEKKFSPKCAYGKPIPTLLPIW